MLAFSAFLCLKKANSLKFSRSREQIRLLYLPTQMRFLIEGKHVTCRGSKLTSSLVRTKLTNSLGNNLNFRLARDQVEPRQIYELAGVKQTISSRFFSTFELGGIPKHLMCLHGLNGFQPLFSKQIMVSECWTRILSKMSHKESCNQV